METVLRRDSTRTSNPKNTDTLQDTRKDLSFEKPWYRGGQGRTQWVNPESSGNPGDTVTHPPGRRGWTLDTSQGAGRCRDEVLRGQGPAVASLRVVAGDEVADATTQVPRVAQGHPDPENSRKVLVHGVGSTGELR